jgi:subtilase family serine protease
MPDVSYVADPNTGVLVVYKGSLYIFGGTSVGTPQWAALIALANSGAGSNLGNGSAHTLLYQAAQGAVQSDGNYEINSTYFWDISVGGTDPTDGYDSFLGIGSPVGNNLVSHL